MRVSLPHRSTQWAILAGVAYVLCFPRYDLPLLSLLFMPGLLFALHAVDTRRRAVLLGFLLSAMIAWGGFHWIIYVAQYFGNLPFVAAVGLLCLFCLVAAPQLVAFFFLGHRLRFGIERQPLMLRPLFWAVLYTGLEFIARFLKIFPENLGNTLIHYLSLAQAASLGGVSLLSFLPLWIGASLYYVRKNGRAALPSLVASLAITAGLCAWGQREIRRLERAPHSTLRVGFVQHNIEEVEKLAQRTGVRQAITFTIQRLLDHTRTLATQKPDLILWPETSYPMAFPTQPSPLLKKSGLIGYANLVSDTVKAGGIPLLFGGYENDGVRDFNSGILLGPDGKVQSTYRKQVLLVFGEYIPLTETFPVLKALNPEMGDFGRGPGPVPVPFSWQGHNVLLGINICYEAILPEYMRPYAQRGSRLFVNLTKDSWFGDTFEPWEHFQLSALRAIEHHVPMIRATNTGLSGLVTETGATELLSDPFHEAVKVLAVPIPDAVDPTLYTRWGEWFAGLCLLFSCLLGFRAYRK